LKKLGWATFWAIFSQTHLVTLPAVRRWEQWRRFFRAVLESAEFEINWGRFDKQPIPKLGPIWSTTDLFNTYGFGHLFRINVAGKDEIIF
jgi:hypothetical protein